MKITWSAAAWADVGRIYAFLAERDLDAADQAFDRLLNAPSQLLNFPRRGRD
jgi:plasmid stabilization system protein ParE